MSELPIMYEVKVILPDVESLAQSEKSLIAANFTGDMSREEEIDERVRQHYPQSVEHSVRIMRRREIKKITHKPIDQRLVEGGVTLAMRQVRLMA